MERYGSAFVPQRVRPPVCPCCHDSSSVSARSCRLLSLSRLTIMAAATAMVLLMAQILTAIAASRMQEERAPVFDEGFRPLFGEGNLQVSPDGRTVRAALSRDTGSGFISRDYFHHGFFSADIKLPSDDTAGIVVAFYLSNEDVLKKNRHDELDFEFLGNRAGHEWKVQTNVYGNGSTSRGREERYRMPFDPTAAAHCYSILWSNATVIFYVDGVPIREVPRSDAMGGDYPSKPMALYVTIWDGSGWATDGGKYKTDYSRGPLTAEFSNLVLHGCSAGDAAAVLRLAEHVDEGSSMSASTQQHCGAGAEYGVMTPRKRAAMRRFRRKYMLYSVCYDRKRYPAGLPECDVKEAERQMFGPWGDSKTVRLRVRSRRGRASLLASMQQAD